MVQMLVGERSAVKAEVASGQRLTREKRVLLTGAEERQIERLVGRMGEGLGTPLELSHVLRSCVSVLCHAGRELVERTENGPRLTRPANADAVALAQFEHELAKLLADALRSTPPPQVTFSQPRVIAITRASRTSFHISAPSPRVRAPLNVHVQTMSRNARLCLTSSNASGCLPHPIPPQQEFARELILDDVSRAGSFPPPVGHRTGGGARVDPSGRARTDAQVTHAPTPGAARTHFALGTIPVALAEAPRFLRSIRLRPVPPRRSPGHGCLAHRSRGPPARPGCRRRGRGRTA